MDLSKTATLLAQADLALLRLCGLTLSLLVDKGVATNEQVRHLIEDGMKPLSADHPHLPAFEALIDEFR
ncbi:hypothetical protein M2341_002009 [Sphingobium sp. B7D2B]|uniref:hypothetical protein n=1 Tax=Sphingobium sp. B7D2B TaxID=2940583 RepID=UPI0022252CA5|nr:hypothetical protein [Sphingobium sp. B7D2B]MCW2366562.1 hypothetical protein [Sphingobium sp. B7D2B]